MRKIIDNLSMIIIQITTLVLLTCQPSHADTPPPFLLMWGSNGTGNGQFNNPYGVAVGSNGNIYVADYSNNRIEVFTSLGAYITKWGGMGDSNGQFRNPYGLAVAGNGNVYVADFHNNRIQVFSSTGSFLTKWGNYGTGNGQLMIPSAVAVGPNGNVYVSDSGNNRIQIFTSSGNYLSQWGSYGNGNGQFYNPGAITIDNNGNVFVADPYNDRVQKFTSSGVYLTQWGVHGTGDGMFQGPSAVCVDSDGNVYVTDGGNSRIQKFTGSGAYLVQWGTYGSGTGQFTVPSGVALDANGNVYVSDVFNHRIEKFGPGPGLPPILFVHGLCSDASMWETNSFKQAFTDAGFPTYSISFANNGAGPKDDVPELAAKIRSIPMGPVTIIAHSMGGLITREYIAESYDAGQDSRVGSVITLGTPHHGSEWADFGTAFWLTGVLKKIWPCNLSAAALVDLVPGSGFLNGLNYGADRSKWDQERHRTNESHAPENLRQAGVTYYSFGGSSGLCGGVNGIVNFFVFRDNNYSHDGAVGYLSDRLYAPGTHNWADFQVNIDGPLGHDPADGTTFCRPGYLESPILRQTIINILEGVIPPDPSSGVASELTVSADSMSQELSYLPLMTGIISPGQVVEQIFTLPTTSKMQILLGSTDAHLQLQTPSGTILTVSDTSTAGGIQFLADPENGLEAFLVANPQPGQWHLRVDATSSAMAQNYTGLVQFVSARDAQVVVSESLVYPGQTTIIRASVDSTGVTLPNVTWTCSITAPDSTTSALTLYDDGAHGDSLAHDGIFGNSFSPSGPIGFYDLTAQATLSDGVTIVTGSNVELAPANDLAVLSNQISLSQNTVAAGDSVQIIATVHNYGTSLVTGAEVEVWDDKTGVRLDSLNVNLPAGGAVTISAPWVVTPPDTHAIRVTVSPFTLSSEISYTNNSGFKTVILGQPVNAVPAGSRRPQLDLAPPRPNPSTGQTILAFSLARESEASLTIYDVLGRRIRQWHWTKLTAGPHQVTWDGQADDGHRIAPGILFYRLSVNGQQLKQKLIHLQ